MNFLAHLYLAGQDEELIIGNFIGDSVKGKLALKNFPVGVQHGIMMHREIDRFMDTHATVRQGTHRIRDSFGKYAPIVMDMYYDHILAKNWSDYSSQELAHFIDAKYDLIDRNIHLLPEKALQMFPYMKKSNWLLQYKSLEGLDQIFKQMDIRTGRKSGMHDAIPPLTRDYAFLEEEFMHFFKDIIDHFENKWKPDLAF